MEQRCPPRLFLTRSPAASSCSGSRSLSEPPRALVGAGNQSITPHIAQTHPNHLSPPCWWQLSPCRSLSQLHCNLCSISFTRNVFMLVICVRFTVFASLIYNPGLCCSRICCALLLTPKFNRSGTCCFLKLEVESLRKNTDQPFPKVNF